VTTSSRRAGWRTEQAARWFAQAALDNERAGALPWAAHAQLDHGRMLRAEGDRGAAGHLLEQAAGTYRKLGMTAWATRCEVAAVVS